MAGIRALVPGLTRNAWIILGGDLLSAVGTGLTLPFLVVYLHRVRGIDLGLAGLALSLFAAAGLAANPLGGWLTDRVGARRTLLAGLLIAAAASIWFAFVHRPWEALTSSALFGFGGFTALPAQDSLLATVVAPAQRSSVFAVRYTTLNVGMGIGMVTSSLIVDLSSARSFQLIYVLDAATFVGFAAILARLSGVGRPVAEEQEEGAGGYRQVLGDRLFLRVWAIMALLTTFGYAQYQATFPVYATEHGLSAGQLGVVFAANMVAVVTLQLVVLRLMQGRRRTRGIVALCACFAAAWGVALGAGSLGGGLAAVVAFAVAMITLALGETFVPPTIQPLVNDLAPDHLRGRYNGAFSLAWTGGYMVGPAIAGFALATGHPTALVLAFVAGFALAALAALDLERRLPPEANRVGEAEAEPFDVEPVELVHASAE